MSPRDLKRENFDVSPEQQADIEMLQQLTGTSSKKEAVLWGVKMALLLAAEIRKGNQLFIGHKGSDLDRFVLLGIERPDTRPWMYLVEHEDSWKRQLYVKGRKLLASSVWSAIRSNDLTVKEAAYNWDLPEEAIREIIEYCESNRILIQMEAQEERLRLMHKGINVDSPAPC
jgi:hypothetical protein